MFGQVFQVAIILYSLRITYMFSSIGYTFSYLRHTYPMTIEAMRLGSSVYIYLPQQTRK